MTPIRRQMRRSCCLLLGAALALLAAGCGSGGDPTTGPSKRASRPDATTIASPDAGPGRPAGMTPETSPIRFVEESRAHGIDFLQTNGASAEKYFVEVLGSGAIFFDADGDGDPDLYLLNQTKIADLPPTAVLPPAGPNDTSPHSVLYLNDGTGHFTDATLASGLGDASYQLGVCGADIDNDGDTDLYVTRFDRDNVLWRNDGGGHFTDVTQAAGVAGSVLTDSSCAFADLDRDGFVDLYVGAYVDHTRDHNILCERRLKATGEKVREYCTPRHYKPARDLLFRNRGDGTFEDVTDSSGVSTAQGRSLGVAIADADNDGDDDVYVACDRTASLFYENLGGMHLREVAHSSGIALSQEGMEEAGMGTAWGDYDNDGLPDLVKTNYEAEVNNLYRNLGGLRFAEIGGAAGTAEASYPYLGWGTGFFDANNDGLLDTFVVNGHLRDNLDQYMKKSGGLAGYAQYNLFFWQQKPGSFLFLGDAAGPGFAIRKAHRGAAWCDVDGDGDLDLLTTSLNATADLLINESPHPGHWLEIRCTGTKSNRSAIGARLILESGQPPVSQMREVSSGQSYLCQSDLTVHFGLGAATKATKLTIHWPSGLVESHTSLAADRVYAATEAKGIEPVSSVRER